MSPPSSFRPLPAARNVSNLIVCIFVTLFQKSFFALHFKFFCKRLNGAIDNTHAVSCEWIAPALLLMHDFESWKFCSHIHIHTRVQQNVSVCVLLQLSNCCVYLMSTACLCVWVSACCSTVRLLAISYCCRVCRIFVCVCVCMCYFGYYYWYSHYEIKRARSVCLCPCLSLCVCSCDCVSYESFSARVNTAQLWLAKSLLHILFVVTVTHERATLRNVNHLPNRIAVCLNAFQCIRLWASLWVCMCVCDVRVWHLCEC